MKIADFILKSLYSYISRIYTIFNNYTLISNLNFKDCMPIVISLIKSIKNIFGECNSMNILFFYKRLVLYTRYSRC
jgi:hypothetical protein